MNGTVEVTSELNVGTCFTLEIPFEIDHDRTAGEKLEEAAEKIDLKDMRILLAEDNELNAEIAADVLQEQHAEVEFAENGLVSVEKFGASPDSGFDLILMDMNMPEMDGLEAARRIRAMNRPDARTVPIFAMTAAVYQEDIDQTLAAGMDAHLIKPLDAEAISRELGLWMEKQSSQS